MEGDTIALLNRRGKRLSISQGRSGRAHLQGSNIDLDNNNAQQSTRTSPNGIAYQLVRSSTKQSCCGAAESFAPRRGGPPFCLTCWRRDLAGSDRNVLNLLPQGYIREQPKRLGMLQPHQLLSAQAEIARREVTVPSAPTQLGRPSSTSMQDLVIVTPFAPFALHILSAQSYRYDEQIPHVSKCCSPAFPVLCHSRFSDSSFPCDHHKFHHPRHNRQLGLKKGSRCYREPRTSLCVDLPNRRRATQDRCKLTFFHNAQHFGLGETLPYIRGSCVDQGCVSFQHHRVILVSMSQPNFPANRNLTQALRPSF